MLPGPRLLTILALSAVAAAVSAGPAMAKSDHDGMPDRWEKRHHLNVRVNDAARDKDRDGLSNYGEYRSHTNPRKRDTDRDHRSDGREDYDRDKLSNTQEIKTANDPGDADTDDDGIKDGRENAGRITAIGGGSVTILLAAGGKNLTARLGPDLFCAAASATPWSEAPAPPTGGDEGDDVPDPGEDDESDEAPGDDWPNDDAEAAASQADEDADPGEDAPDDGVLDPDAMACAAALKVGAFVHQAEILHTGDGVVLVTVDLVAAPR